MFKRYFGAATATYGGRNRARTCDPLIKSYVHPRRRVFDRNIEFRVRIIFTIFNKLFRRHHMTFKAHR